MRIFERLAKDRGFMERACLAQIGLALATLLLVLLITRPVQSADMDYAGFVLKVQGDCSMNGSALKDFERVPPGAVINFSAKHREDDKIEIVLTNGQLLEIDCKEFGKCDKRVHIRIQRNPDPLVKRLLRVSLDPFNDYVTAISRGLSVSKEVVLKLHKGRLDLLPLLEGEPAGSYALDFRRRSTVNKPVAPVFEVPIVWDPKTPAAAESARTSKAIPGLFAVKYAGDNENEEARALIVPQRDYEFAQEQFQQARKLAESWGETSALPQRLQHRFLRLYLWYLASSTAEKQKAR
jgi:hypothetical protein